MDENPYRGPELGDGGSPATQKKSPLRIVFSLLIVLGIVAIVICLLLPTVRFAGPASRRNDCAHQLRQITIALQNYSDVYHALPPAYTVDADGKPLHSSRTLILPYLEQQRLYETIDLSKPWDDPANAEACKTRLDAYQCPADDFSGNRTTYLAIVTPGSCLRPGEPRPLSDITDGTSKTLLLIEVDAEHAVPWMSPVDADEQVVLGIGPESKLAHASGVNAAMVDGSVHFLDAGTPAPLRRALISIAGNDKVVDRGAD